MVELRSEHRCGSLGLPLSHHSSSTSEPSSRTGSRLSKYTWCQSRHFQTGLSAFSAPDNPVTAPGASGTALKSPTMSPGLLSPIQALMELHWDVCPPPRRSSCDHFLVPDHGRPGLGVSEPWAGGCLQSPFCGVLDRTAAAEKQRLSWIVKSLGVLQEQTSLSASSPSLPGRTAEACTWPGPKAQI